MKKTSLCLTGLLIWLMSAGQLPVAPDTLFPKKTQSDTVKPEPKLKGGALIDTVNTKKKRFNPMNDTLPKNPKQRRDTIPRHVK